MAEVMNSMTVEDGADLLPNSSCQRSELENLGVTVYNNEDLEQRVARNFELEESKALLDATENQIKTIDEKLEVVIQEVNTCENALQNVCEGGGFNGRKCRSLLSEQEKLSIKRADLLEKRSDAQSKRDKALRVLELASKDLNIAKDTLSTSESVHDLTSRAKDPDVTKTSLNSEENRNEPQPSMPEETQKEKDIRLGMMTGFGTLLKSHTGNLVKSQDNDEEPPRPEYLKELNEDKTYIDKDRNQANQKRSLPSNDCNERANKLKRIRPWTESSSDSTSEKRKDVDLEESDKNLNAKRKEKTGWGTDDSDWESSSGDESPSKSHLRKPKSRHDKRKVLDDGDRQEYINRLEEWHENRTQEEITSDSVYEELEGGLRVPIAIWTQLYHYQRVGVQWLWELDQQKVGGILGDEMGLGKTIQVIAFLSSLALSQKKLRRNKLGLSLIVCPTTVMYQWVREFQKWWPPFRVSILHESGSYIGSKLSLIRELGRSTAGGSILVTSYSAVTTYQDALHNENFDYVILDEGHKIRNPDAQITLAVKQFSTSHRIILSGSPLQNNLKELWSLFDFIYPGKLGTLPVFLQQFSVPITIGGYSNASKTQVATAYKCASILRDTINPYLLRRMKSDVQAHISLPEKNDQVLFCRLTEEQRKLYRDYLSSDDVRNILDGRFKVFMGLTTLRKICNHPDLFDGGPKHVGGPAIEEDDDKNNHEFGYWKRSGKMIVIEALLKLWKGQNHKVLLFSQSKQMILILQSFVQSRGYTYMKMDGQTSIGSRQTLIEKFNQNSDIFVFLLTTKVGGLGVNLTGASRVVIFDPDWNPSTDMQARERAWRIGQNKEVTIYRLLISGTIEEKIYHRQIFKQLLINRVLKDPTQRRFFKSNDLHDLFTLSEGTSNKTETSALFAGTGSEVKPKSTRHYKKLAEERRAAERKMAEEKLKEAAIAVHDKSKEVDKQAALREKVKLISQKIASRKLQKEEEESSNNSETIDNLIESKKSSHKLNQSRNTNFKEKDRAPSTSSTSSKENKTSHHRRHKHKKEKSAKFEGHRISHLVKLDSLQANDNVTGCKSKDKGAETGKEQDQYVLSKLFKKSGVHSAVKHDMIVEGGGADFALIEGEAEKVAKDAVTKLRESRRLCFRAESGLPTWTGNNGVRVQPKKRFGRQTKASVNTATNIEGRAQEKITANELLCRMRKRNGEISGDTELFQPDSINENVDLLTEIRNFIAFQCESIIDGEATTDQLVNRFRDKLPPRQNPLFKALLNEICILYRDSNGHGVWKLKQEFR